MRARRVSVLAVGAFLALLVLLTGVLAATRLLGDPAPAASTASLTSTPSTTCDPADPGGSPGTTVSEDPTAGSDAPGGSGTGGSGAAGGPVGGSCGPVPPVVAAPSSPTDPVPTGRVAQDRLGPVLLVPGYGGGRDALEVLAGHIRATGRTATVLTLPGDGTGDFTAQVAVLDRAADAVVAAGAPSVDVVGFSAGGVVAGLWVARSDGADQARRVVSLGSPLRGSELAAQGAARFPDACPAACRQLVPGNPVLAELHAAAVGTRVPWLSVWTTRDEIVTPVESARLDGAVNVALQSVCPASVVTHGGLPIDADVTALVLFALTPGPLTAPTTCRP